MKIITGGKFMYYCSNPSKKIIPGKIQMTGDDKGRHAGTTFKVKTISDHDNINAKTESLKPDEVKYSGNISKFEDTDRYELTINRQDEIKNNSDSDPQCHIEQYTYSLKNFIEIRNNIFHNMEFDRAWVPAAVLKSLTFSDGEISLNLQFLSCLFKDIVNCVQHLHKNMRIHQNLKPENIIFTESASKTSQVNPFRPLKGYLTELESFEPRLVMINNDDCGLYAAPEMCTGVYSEKVDIFSLGLIFFEMIFPFKTEMERIEMIGILKNTGKISTSVKYNHNIERSIIEWCVLKEGEKRPTINELLGKTTTLCTPVKYPRKVYVTK